MTISVPVARLRSGRQGLCPTSVGIGWMLETSSLRRRECVKASFRSLQLPPPSFILEDACIAEWVDDSSATVEEELK